MAFDAVVTNAGVALLREVLAGEILTLDNAAGAAGTVPVSALMAQTALTDQRQTFSVVSSFDVPNGKKLGVAIGNAGLAAGYVMRQLGVWAHIGTDAPVLFAILQDATGIAIPAYADMPDFSMMFYLVIAFNNDAPFSVIVDPSTLVTVGMMQQAIAAAMATKQDIITAYGVLKRNDDGSIAGAVAGVDYGFPLKSGAGAPTSSTQGQVGQHYLDTSTGKEYVCTNASGAVFTWKLTGATDASELTYDGGPLDEALEEIEDGLANKAPKTITGTSAPTTSTVGEVGQFYLDTATDEVFVCTDVSGGVYTWKPVCDSPLYPQIVVTVTAGAVVTCTDGTTMLTGTSAGTITFDIPNYGDWTLQADLAGDLSDSVTVTVDAVQQYAVTLTFTSAVITVTAETGASVTATDGTHIYTGTTNAQGTCSLIVRFLGTYTVTAVKNNATSSQATVDVLANGQVYTATVTWITLTITVDSGSAVSVTDGVTTLTGTSAGTVKFYLPNMGTWTATATLFGQTATDSVTASAYTDYALELDYNLNVFGVSWDMSNSSTALTRLTTATDPNNLVTVDVTTEPSPAVGTGAGSSPFDNYLPWSGIDEFNVINNALGPQKGDSGFSRTTNDTVVRIPKYYYKIEQDGTTIRFYIANKATPGLSVHPAFNRGDGLVHPYIYIGRYHTSSGYVSKSGVPPLASITRAEARTGSHDKGSYWWQFDYAAWCAVWLLYLVEFADWNSQAKVGYGNTYMSTLKNNGGTDSMNYHTGREDGTYNQVAAQYRHIENLWCNIYQWVDGINFHNRLAYVCLNPANFEDDTETNYTYTDVTIANTRGDITAITISSVFPFAFLPTAAGGSGTTYIPDYFSSNSSNWRILDIGGDWQDSSNCGLFCFYAISSSSSKSSLTGARLLFLP